METKQMFMNDAESSNRPAWTQYETAEGMGSGLNSFKNKQQDGKAGFKKDYYVKSRGCK